MNGFGSHIPNISTPDRNNGSVAESEPELNTLYKQFEHYQQTDREKTKFMGVGHKLHSNTRATSLTSPRNY
jgi:hypothetical protein